MKEKLTTIRLSLDLDKELDKMAQIKDTNKSKLIRDLLILGLREKRSEEALDLYQQGRISLWKAARLSDISLWKMMEIVAERKIPAQYGEKELKEDMKAFKHK